MNELPEPLILKLLRHGQSVGNKGDVFQGGGPDNGVNPDGSPRGPTVLSNPEGIRQSKAAGIMAAKHNITVEYVTTSPMVRAIQTGELLAEGYGGDVQVLDERLAGFQEINHGSIEWQVTNNEAKARRWHTVCEVTHSLLNRGLHVELLGHVPWVIPNGRGDGESYIDAALRGIAILESHHHKPNEIIVGHNGVMRQARALAMHLTAAERHMLLRRHTQLRIEHPRLDPEELAKLDNQEILRVLRLGADALKGMVELLYDLALPDLETVNDARKRIDNAELVEVRIEPDGKWAPLCRTKPEFPSDPTIPLTAENVHARIWPFRSIEDWL